MAGKTTKARARKPKAKRSGKVRDVLEHVLTGAALGAVKGAAQAIVPEIAGEQNGRDKQTKQNKT